VVVGRVWPYRRLRENEVPLGNWSSGSFTGSAWAPKRGCRASGRLRQNTTTASVQCIPWLMGSTTNAWVQESGHV
jgi:hypothetical protein